MSLQITETAPQHLVALNTANTIRLDRARHKKQVRELPRADAYNRMADLLLELPRELESLTILDFFMWPQRSGRQLGLRWLRKINDLQTWGLPVSENRPLEKLTFRQAAFIAGWLREEADRASRVAA
jgi:hypothetical protein